MGDWTGTVPTFTAGAKLRGVDMDTVADILTALTSAETAYTPVWTSSGTPPTQGNVTITGKYRRLGKLVFYDIRWIFGSTSAVGTGNYFFTLPVASVALPGTTDWPAGSGVYVDVSTANRYVVTATISTTTTVWLNIAAGGNPGVFGAATPVASATGDWFSVGGWYEAA